MSTLSVGRGVCGTGRGGSGGAGHGEEGVGGSLGLGSGEVVGGGGVAEAVAGFGPVGVPFGFEEPGEDLVELGPGRLGEVARQGPATVGVWSHGDVAVGVEALVAGEVAVGVGEGFPHACSAFEFVVRAVDGVVQQ